MKILDWIFSLSIATAVVADLHFVSIPNCWFALIPLLALTLVWQFVRTWLE